MWRIQKLRYFLGIFCVHLPLHSKIFTAIVAPFLQSTYKSLIIISLGSLFILVAVAIVVVLVAEPFVYSFVEVGCCCKEIG